MKTKVYGAIHESVNTISDLVLTVSQKKKKKEKKKETQIKYRGDRFVDHPV